MKQKKNYDIEVGDFFWARNAATPFPQVAEDVDREINRYKRDVDEMTKANNVQSLEEIGDAIKYVYNPFL